MQDGGIGMINNKCTILVVSFIAVNKCVDVKIIGNSTIGKVVSEAMKYFYKIFDETLNECHMENIIVASKENKGLLDMNKTVDYYKLGNGCNILIAQKD